MAETKPQLKVVRASNENQVLFHGNEEDARDFVEMNFPRHHVDPASPVMEDPVPDVYLVGQGGQKEMYLGPEEAEPWVRVGGSKTPGGKS